jgi:hypothetical protein
MSNYSWLDGLSFTEMRERYLDAFDRVWIDCLNGDKYKTGKLTPEGEPDPSVFSTEFNAEGIQVGTAIALLVRNIAVPPAMADSSNASTLLASWRGLEVARPSRPLSRERPAPAHKKSTGKMPVPQRAGTPALRCLVTSPATSI